MQLYDVRKEPFKIYGVFYDEKEGKFFRMDKAVADKVSVNVGKLCSNTSGGRIKFSTDSEEIAVKLSYPVKENYYHISKFGTIGCVLSEETEDGVKLAHSFAPGNLYNASATEDENGYTVEMRIKGGKMRKYILFLPNYNDVKSVKIGLSDGAKLCEGKPYKDVLPILYYGSSITQGACASRPDLSYPAIISKWNDVDYINLGFSGSALGEDEMINYLAKIKCSLFVCDYDYNAPSAEHLKKTHLKLFRAFRKTHPKTPVLFMTAAYTPREFDEIEERVAVIKNTFDTAKAEGDKNVYFLDGRTFFDKKEAELVSIEGLHPNDIGFYFMAKGVYKKIVEIDRIYE